LRALAELTLRFFCYPSRLLTQAPYDFSSVPITDPTHLHKTAPCRQLEK
jgi:hypothetical protein